MDACPCSKENHEEHPCLSLKFLSTALLNSIDFLPKEATAGEFENIIVRLGLHQICSKLVHIRHAKEPTMEKLKNEVSEVAMLT